MTKPEFRREIVFRASDQDTRPTFPNHWIQPHEEHLVTEDRTFFFNFMGDERIPTEPEEQATPDDLLRYMVDSIYDGGVLLIPGNHARMTTLTEWAQRGCAARSVDGIGPVILAPGVLGIDGTSIRVHVRAYVMTDRARMRGVGPAASIAGYEVR